MTERIRTYAKVKAQITIELNDSWGPECTLDQVLRQAKDGASLALTSLCQNYRTPLGACFRDASVLSVLAQTVKEEA